MTEPRDWEVEVWEVRQSDGWPTRRFHAKSQGWLLRHLAMLANGGTLGRDLQLAFDGYAQTCLRPVGPDKVVEITHGY